MAAIGLLVLDRAAWASVVEDPAAFEKLGFERIGEMMDPEVGRAWRWERDRV